MRLTIICPAQHRDDANHYAMALGESEADGLTYGEPSWQDASGNLYSVASLPVSDSFIAWATGTLDRPEWDAKPYAINMAAANRAQALVQVWQPSEENNQPPQANTATILAMVGNAPLELLEAAGLTKGTADDRNDS
jgi:hypothetical protein